MNKKFLIILVVSILVGIFSIGGVYSANLVKSYSSEGNGNILFIFKRLNLTDEQKEEIKKILDELKEKAKPILNNIKDLTLKEKEIISKEVLDETNLNLVVESQIKNLVDLFYLKKDAYLKIVEVLNDEQRKIFPTFILFSKTKPFILGNDKINDFFEKINNRIKDLIIIGKRLNLTDEQKEILNEMIKEENSKKFKFLHQIDLRFLIKRLNLTEEQVNQVKDLFNMEKEKEKEFLSKIRDNNSKQREILKSDSFNIETLSSYIDEYIVLENEILNLRKDLYFNFLKILTPEQRQKSVTSIFFFKLI